MGEFTGSSIVAANRSYRALFLNEVSQVVPAWPKIATETQSTGKDETYQWLGSVPSIKEWLGNKQLEQLRAFDYTIKNKDWESTIEVDRNDFEDDRLGMHNVRVRELGAEGARHPDELVSLTRQGGDQNLCFDGQFFYDTDHKIGDSPLQSNVLTGGGTTRDALVADFRKARAMIRNYKNDRGKPYIHRSGKLDLTVTVHPDLEGVWEEILNASIISNTENVLKGAATLEVDPYLVDANDWYLDFTGGIVKGMINQVRKKATLVMLGEEEASVLAFMSRKVLYSVEARYNVGYGLWWESVKIANT